MEVRECIIEDEELHGVYAMGYVSDPAIQENWIALSNVQLKAEPDKRIVTGAVLIPDKPIVRLTPEGDEYHIVFREATIRKSAHLFLKRNNHHTATIEHQFAVPGISVMESWIVEDSKKDKAAVLGFNVPKGTWMLSAYVKDDTIWNDMIKGGMLKGFSIEGKFKQVEAKLGGQTGGQSGGQITLEQMIEEILQDSYSDYPEGATNNAKRALDWLRENENPNDCLTDVGFARANQLANREPISLDTIKRMYNFKRHEQNKDVPYTEGCGGIAWDAWGGSAGIRWAESKLRELGQID